MSKFLFDVQQKNRLEQKGLLKRFSITCYGHQESVEEIRAFKAAKYKELKQKGNREEFQEWFLNYKPDDFKKKKEEDMENKKNKNTNYKTHKKKTQRKKRTKKSNKFAIYGGKTRRHI
jgi:hypothetical protein